MKRIYLDYAATTPTDPEVVKAMLPYFNEKFGNASTLYSYGQESRSAIEKARESVARLIGAKDEEIVFTGGGTEADNHALKGVAFANEGKKNHIITSTIEHHAISNSAKFLEERGFKVTYLPVDKYGVVGPDAVRKAITPKTILVSIMHANNEAGTIEPIEEIGRITREKGIYFHTDAVQTTGHLPIDVDKLGVDLLAMSAHKLYGPKGVGALYIRKGTKIASFIHGGEQESGRRASTENVAGIVGFGKAAELALAELKSEAKRVSQLRDKLIRGLQAKIGQTHLNGHPTRRLPNNLNLSIEFVEGEAILVSLDNEGICVSTGSACSSGSMEPSHVLMGLGLSHEMARGAVRFSLGKWTTEEEIDHVLEVVPRVVGKLRSISPLAKTNKC